MAQLAACFSLVASLWGVAAHAQMTPTQRFEDCVNIRHQAQSYKSWLTAPCHKDLSCDPSANQLGQEERFFACFEEGYSACAFQYRQSPDSLVACDREVDALVQKSHEKIDAKQLLARVDILIEQENRLVRRGLERRKAIALEGVAFNCNKFLGANVHNLPKAEFCDRVQRIWNASSAEALAARVSQLEAQQ